MFYPAVEDLTAASAVDESLDIESASLNLNAKASLLRVPIVGMWELTPTVEQPPGEESELVSYDSVQDRSEAVVGDDGRTLVDPKDFAPGGKYRAIVKLLCHHEFQPKDSWMMGTGWLIRNDLLVTAGHCTYDWAHRFGRVTEVKAYIGYHGRQNVEDSNVQFRHGRKVVAPMDWLTTKGQKARDVGFIQLEKPFEDIEPIKYADTPAVGKNKLGIVGYPGDKIDDGTKEKGAHMYEMFEETTWNLASSEETMLEYTIDTGGGNSGSPVLIEGRNTSIGAHVYGGIGKAVNSASVIGKYGNPFKDYVKAFEILIAEDKALHLQPVPQQTKLSGTPSQLLPAFDAGRQTKGNRSRRAITPTPYRSGTGGFGEASKEGFMDLKFTQPSRGVGLSMAHGPRFAAPTMEASEVEEGIIDIIGSVASAAAPIIGGFGGPFGAIAGFLLSAVPRIAKMAESEGAEAASTVNIHEGALERAVLGQASLVALQRMNLTEEEEEGILADIQDTVTRSLPAVKKVAAKVLPAMIEPALRMALDHLHKYNQSAEDAEAFGDAEAAFLPLFPYSRSIDRPSSDRNFNALIGAAESAGAEEGFIDFLKIAGQNAGKGLAIAAQYGLPLLLKGISALSEAEEIGPDAASSGGISAENLATRALVGDAALNAILKRMPPKRLEEEGFIDIVKKYGEIFMPAVKVIAPTLLDRIHPVAGKIARKFLGESTMNDVPMLAPVGSRKGLRRFGGQVTPRAAPSRQMFQQLPRDLTQVY